MEGHTGSVYSVCVTPDGTHVVTGSYDKTARVHELQWTLSERLDQLATSTCWPAGWEEQLAKLMTKDAAWEKRDQVSTTRPSPPGAPVRPRPSAKPVHIDTISVPQDGCVPRFSCC